MRNEGEGTSIHCLQNNGWGGVGKGVKGKVTEKVETCMECSFNIQSIRYNQAAHEHEGKSRKYQ